MQDNHTSATDSPVHYGNGTESKLSIFWLSCLFLFIALLLGGGCAAALGVALLS